MSTLTVIPDPVAQNVVFSEHAVCFELADGRSISAPLEWFPSLRDATPEQRANWERGIHWPDVDEDISIAGLMGLPD